jgi:hypothetical protein
LPCNVEVRARCRSKEWFLSSARNFVIAPRIAFAPSSVGPAGWTSPRVRSTEPATSAHAARAAAPLPHDTTSDSAPAGST